LDCAFDYPVNKEHVSSGIRE